MAPGNHTVFIAGHLSAADWAVARDALQANNSPEEWKKVFDAFFQQRLRLRYLSPIATLQDNDSYTGEGFTITAIQCTLIEFLAATKAGKNYRYGMPADQHHYFNSSAMFIEFLSTEPPFRTYFDTATAKAFYENVRCGLLHEARTKGGWTIWAQSDGLTVIDRTEKVVYRNDLQHVILEFISKYREALSADRSLQEAFIRKFNYLAQ